MKRLLVSLAVIGSLAAIPVSNVLWGKGHVLAHKEQVCHSGFVNTVGNSAVGRHLAHGDCFIDKLEGGAGNVFFTGDTCAQPADCDTFPRI